MNGWQVAWLIWGGAFAVIEGIALANKKPDDTLSEQVWALFATSKEARGRPVVTGWVRFRRFVLAAFMAWLSLHFLTGGLF